MPYYFWALLILAVVDMALIVILFYRLNEHKKGNTKT
jgi:hypothetical protein